MATDGDDGRLPVDVVEADLRALLTGTLTPGRVIKLLPFVAFREGRNVLRSGVPPTVLIDVASRGGEIWSKGGSIPPVLMTDGSHTVLRISDLPGAWGFEWASNRFGKPIIETPAPPPSSDGRGWCVAEALAALIAPGDPAALQRLKNDLGAYPTAADVLEAWPMVQFHTDNGRVYGVRPNPLIRIDLERSGPYYHAVCATYIARAEQDRLDGNGSPVDDRRPIGARVDGPGAKTKAPFIPMATAKAVLTRAIQLTDHPDEPLDYTRRMLWSGKASGLIEPAAVQRLKPPRVAGRLNGEAAKDHRKQTALYELAMAFNHAAQGRRTAKTIDWLAPTVGLVADVLEMSASNLRKEVGHASRMFQTWGSIPSTMSLPRFEGEIPLIRGAAKHGDLGTVPKHEMMGTARRVGHGFTSEAILDVRANTSPGQEATIFSLVRPRELIFLGGVAATTYVGARADFEGVKVPSRDPTADVPQCEREDLMRVALSIPGPVIIIVHDRTEDLVLALEVVEARRHIAFGGAPTSVYYSLPDHALPNGTMLPATNGNGARYAWNLSPADRELAKNVGIWPPGVEGMIIGGTVKIADRNRAGDVVGETIHPRSILGPTVSGFRDFFADRVAEPEVHCAVALNHYYGHCAGVVWSGFNQRAVWTGPMRTRVSALPTRPLTGKAQAASEAAADGMGFEVETVGEVELFHPGVTLGNEPADTRTGGERRPAAASNRPPKVKGGGRQDARPGAGALPPVARPGPARTPDPPKFPPRPVPPPRQNTPPPQKEPVARRPEPPNQTPVNAPPEAPRQPKPVPVRRDDRATYAAAVGSVHADRRGQFRPTPANQLAPELARLVGTEPSDRPPPRPREAFPVTDGGPFGKACRARVAGQPAAFTAADLKRALGASDHPTDCGCVVCYTASLTDNNKSRRQRRSAMRPVPSARRRAAADGFMVARIGHATVPQALNPVPADPYSAVETAASDPACQAEPNEAAVLELPPEPAAPEGPPTTATRGTGDGEALDGEPQGQPPLPPDPAAPPDASPADEAPHTPGPVDQDQPDQPAAEAQGGDQGGAEQPAEPPAGAPAEPAVVPDDPRPDVVPGEGNGDEPPAPDQVPAGPGRPPAAQRDPEDPVNRARSKVCVNVFTAGWETDFEIVAGDSMVAGEYGVYAGCTEAAVASAGPPAIAVPVSIGKRLIEALINKDQGKVTGTISALAPNQINLLRATLGKLDVGELRETSIQLNASKFARYVKAHLLQDDLHHEHTSGYHLKKLEIRARRRRERGPLSRIALWFEEVKLEARRFCCITSAAEDYVDDEVLEVTGHLAFPGPCRDPGNVHALPNVPVLDTGSLTLFGRHDGRGNTLLNPDGRSSYAAHVLLGGSVVTNPLVYDHNKVQAYIVGDRTRKPICYGKHAECTNIGPYITTCIDGVQGRCPNAAQEAVIKRQLNAATSERRSDPAEIDRVEQNFAEDYQRRAAVKPIQSAQVYLIQEWVHHTSSKQAAKFLAEEWQLVDSEINHVRQSNTDAFLKPETQGPKLPGATETEGKVNRLICNQGIPSKLVFIGIVHAIVARICELYPEVSLKHSPEEIERDMACWLAGNADPQLADATAGGLDYERMDASFTPNEKASIERSYELPLNEIFGAIDGFDWPERLEEFRHALNGRRARAISVKDLLGAFLTTVVSGTVFSGDIDTALMDTLCNLRNVVTAIRDTARDMPDVTQDAPELEGHNLFVRVKGDDSIVIARDASAPVVLACYERTAVLQGFKVTREGAALTGVGNRVTFCSRFFMIYAERGDWVVNSIRGPARMFARIGWTAKIGIKTERGRNRLMVAKALSELHCNARAGRAYPVFGAMYAGILASETLRRVNPNFDEESGRKLAEHWGLPHLSAQDINRRARGLARTFEGPTPMQRQAFEDLTGVDADTQVVLEEYLYTTCRDRPRGRLDHPLLAPLLEAGFR